MVEIILVYQEPCHLRCHGGWQHSWDAGTGHICRCTAPSVHRCLGAETSGGASGGWSVSGYLSPAPHASCHTWERGWGGLTILWWLSSQQLCPSPSHLTLNKLPQFFTLKSNRGQSNSRWRKAPPSFFPSAETGFFSGMFSQKEVQSFLNMNKKSHDYIYEACVYSLHQSSEDLTLDKGKEAMVSSASVHISKKKKNSLLLDLTGFE